MPLLRNIPTIHVALPVEGEWVELKSAMTAGDEISMRSAAAVKARFETDASGEQVFVPDMEAGIMAAEFRAAELMITAWSFSEPVTPENIRQLDRASWEAIKDAIGRLTDDTRSEDEEKNSSTSLSPVSTATLAFPESSLNRSSLNAVEVG